MIAGTFRNHELVVELELAGPGGSRHRLEAVVDTGFNGYLTLPEHLVSQLQLQFAGHRRGMLADGSVVLLKMFLASIAWHRTQREVLILQTGGGPLLGMSLLERCRVTFDAVEGGHLKIRELKAK
jgi:clan AA aspartic protease